MKLQKVWLWATCASLLALTLTSSGLAAKRSKKAEVPSKQIELFEGMKSGEIEVKFIPQSSLGANVMIHNKTDQPLTIKLPAAFAGVPVLAQFGDMGGGGFGGAGDFGGGGMGGGGGGQGMGGGFGGMGGGMGGFGGGGFGGMGGGFFNVAPEKTGKIKVKTVCLEHGKPEPTPRMKYTIAPIETLTKDARVVELCKMVGRGEVPQNAAQAAVWHVANGLSWQELAMKDRVRSRLGTIKYFSPRELQLALQIAGVATERAKKSEESTIAQSPGELVEQAYLREKQ
jgi:hypothetical protein